MDKGKAKSTDNPSEKLTDLLVDDSQNARVIDSVGKPPAVKITKKISRSVTINLDQECDDNDIDGDGDVGKRPCKYRTRSMVWDHMTRLPVVVNQEPQAECNYCKKQFTCNTSKNGTGYMKLHLEYKCPKAPDSIKKTNPFQKLINNGLGGIACATYNAESSRIALAEMIVIDELPFKFVESEGFRRLRAALQPKFTLPSRQTVTRDIMKLYAQEKSSLMSKLKGRRICLTSDTWTSVQNVNYMSLTAHYIDCDWVYNKRILNFCIVESHKGEALGKTVEACLINWGIQSIFTISLDNASANNLLVAHLKKRTMDWNDIFCEHEFIHVRCAAHILNLVVADGLKEISDSVEKIRNVVRYVRSSPSRLSAFKRAAQKNRILSSKLFCLDVPTRWNSTYLMLVAANKYKKAFESLQDDDLGYNMYFSEDVDSDETKKVRTKRIGPPQPNDFNVTEVLVEFLKIFYDATVYLSGSTYVNAHACFPELALIQNIINLHVKSSDPLLAGMAQKMKSKFEKYWGCMSKANLLLYIFVVLDPRRKMAYLKFCVKKLLDDKAGDDLLFLVHEAMTKLFMWFLRNGSSSSSAANGNDLDCVTIDDLPKSWGSLEAEFKMQLQLETCAKEAKTELQQHLEDACIVEGDKFDILTWWKINSCRYPIVSQMAMQVLAVPVTTVASEACFSTGGRVLDVFRSSLSPNHVEALVCTQNWIKGTILGAAESKKATEETSAHNEYIANIEELGIELAAKATID